VALNPAKQFQQILGFGGAFTDSTCFMFNQLPSDARAQLFHEMFHPTEMALNVCRTCMGASDYATHVYSYDDGNADPELKRFSIDYDAKNIIPILREARQVNSELFLFSSPWSPPGWMKSGGSMLGGAMQRRHLGTYAHYFVKFLQSYAAEGIAIQAITPQNEVDTDQDGRMPACIWAQEYEIEFVRTLGPLLQRSGLSTKIWILDHNYNLWGRAACELEDAELRKHCKAVAWHGYVGAPEMMSRVHDAHPDVAMHWTEGGPDYTSPDYLTDWAQWGETFSDVLHNWCESITAWNLALDENGKPNLGPFFCGGMVTIHSRTGQISRSGQFWSMAHFSRFVRRGARRLDSVSASPQIKHVLVGNPDQEKVLILTNRGTAQRVTLQLGKSAVDVALDENSVNTLKWW
jgi:glucosylceramidase